MASVVPRGGWLQRLLLWLAGLLFHPRLPRDVGPQRIGLLRFDNRVGELLLQTPLFAAIRRARPDAQIVAVVHPRLAHLLASQPAVDDVLSFDSHGFPWTFASRKRARALMHAQLDVAIDCSNYTLLSTSHALAAVLTRAPVRIGFARNGRGVSCYTSAVAPRPDVASERRQRLHLLSALGIEAWDEAPCYLPNGSVGPEVRQLLDDMLARPRSFTVLNPGGRLGWRRLTADVLAAIGKRLLERGRQPVVVWGPGEQQAAIELCQQIGVKARLAPPTDIPALGALMAAAQCTVTHNSGPMHLSVAVGAPTLGIFKDMPAVRWGYPEPPNAVVDVSGADDPRPLLISALDRFLDGLPQR